MTANDVTLGWILGYLSCLAVFHVLALQGGFRRDADERHPTNYYTAENGASLAYRDAEGRIVGEPDQESDEDEPLVVRRIS